MSRIITILGVIVAVTAQVTPALAQEHPTLASYLTIAGLCAAAVGRELVSPSVFKRKILRKR